MKRVLPSLRKQKQFSNLIKGGEKYLTIVDDEKLCIADAADVARLGMERYEQGMRCEINSLVPLYLRKSEAEERLKESR